MTGAVKKPWAPCPDCGGIKPELDSEGTLIRNNLDDKLCPTCSGSGVAEFCAHVWVARIPNYCVKCHTLWEDRYD